MKGDSSSPRTAPRQSASFMLPYVVAAAFCCFDVFNYYYFFSPITNIWSWGTFQTSKLSMSYLLATSLSSVCLLLFVTFYFSILMSNGYEHKCSSGFSRQMLNLLPYSTRMQSIPISSGSAMLPPIFVSFLDFNFGVFVFCPPNNWQKWDKFEHSAWLQFLDLLSEQRLMHSPLVILACWWASCSYKHVWWEWDLYSGCFLRIY